jgi:hypothetical protein
VATVGVDARELALVRGFARALEAAGRGEGSSGAIDGAARLSCVVMIGKGSSLHLVASFAQGKFHVRVKGLHMNPHRQRGRGAWAGSRRSRNGSEGGGSCAGAAARARTLEDRSGAARDGAWGRGQVRRAGRARCAVPRGGNRSRQGQRSNQGARPRSEGRGVSTVNEPPVSSVSSRAVQSGDAAVTSLGERAIALARSALPNAHGFVSVRRIAAELGVPAADVSGWLGRSGVSRQDSRGVPSSLVGSGERRERRFHVKPLTKRMRTALETLWANHAGTRKALEQRGLVYRGSRLRAHPTRGLASAIAPGSARVSGGGC